MDYSSPAFIEWIILNFILIVVSLVLLRKYFNEKRRMSVEGLLAQA